MFLGHFAVGFASKAAAPKTSVGTLIAAPLFLDLLWPVLLLLGWEEVRIDPGNTAFTPLDFVRYPISHSLLTTIGWALLFALLYAARQRYAAGAAVVGLGVLSHWVLDAISHRPDLPLYPGDGPRVGLGLWNSVVGTVVVEGALFACAVWLYQARTRPLDRTGRYGLWLFVAFLGLFYCGGIVGPPPPGVGALAGVGLAAWILPFWAGWFDRHRVYALPGASIGPDR